MNWANPQPIDQREVDLTEPDDWRALRLTPQDIAQIESELGLRLPLFLTEWLCENRFRDFKDQCRALVCRRDYLIHENVEYRRNGYYGRLWPEEYFWFGDDWGGGAYFVDTASGLSAIFYFSWDSSSGLEVSTAESVRYTPQEFETNLRVELGYG